MTSTVYPWLHFAHLTVVMTWIALAAMSHVYLRRAVRPDNPNHHAEWRRARGLTLAGEMTCVALALVAGLSLVVLDTGLFKQVWFHVKLLMVVLIVAAFVLTSIRQRQVGTALSAGDHDGAKRAHRAYGLFRVLTIVAGIGLLIAVTFRFGEPETIRLP